MQALLVLDDDHAKQVVTSGMDKTVALWQSQGEDLGSGGFAEAARLAPPGGPVFALALDDRQAGGQQPSEVLLANHGKQVLAWVPPSLQLEAGVVLDGHCGWVRALALSQGRWLFSAACGQLRQWDLSRAVPRCVGSVAVERGDIQALAASRDRVFAATSDGALWAWPIGRKGELGAPACHKRAHGDRITALALRGPILFSASYDGGVRAWDAASLELVMAREGAHDGGRLHAAVLGPDGLLYTGGDDALIRRWATSLLQPAAPPLHCHSHSVRSLAAGGRELVVSGDKGGEVAVWKV